MAGNTFPTLFTLPVMSDSSGSDSDDEVQFVSETKTDAVAPANAKAAGLRTTFVGAQLFGRGALRGREHDAAYDAALADALIPWYTSRAARVFVNELRKCGLVRSGFTQNSAVTAKTVAKAVRAIVLSVAPEDGKCPLEDIFGLTDVFGDVTTTDSLVSAVQDIERVISLNADPDANYDDDSDNENYFSDTDNDTVAYNSEDDDDKIVARERDLAEDEDEDEDDADAPVPPKKKIKPSPSPDDYECSQVEDFTTASAP